MLHFSDISGLFRKLWLHLLFIFLSENESKGQVDFLHLFCFRSTIQTV